MAAPLLLAAAEPPPGNIPNDMPEDIVVIARKFDRVTLALRKTGSGALSCSIQRSSGDPEIDGLSCEAASDCSTQMIVSRANRHALEDCIKAERLKMITSLAARQGAHEVAPQVTPLPKAP
jgi:hypothetical protein